MNKGFSLVELIVVIAIMAILVGVAVPVYTSYIKKAEEGVDIQAIDNLEHACKVVNIEFGCEITFAADGKAIVASINAEEDEAIARLAEILGDDAVADADAGTFKVALNSTPAAATVEDAKVKLPETISARS